MSFLTYREIYHILKNKNAKSLDLTEFEISKIVEQVRRETINGSFLVDLKDKFPRGQFPQIRRIYQEIREEHQQEQFFHDELRIPLEEATMDMFSIICGDQNYHDLDDDQKRIITNIIQEDGFNPDDKDNNNSFNHQAWLLAAFYIHHILIEREKVSYSNLELILSPIRINEISQEFTDLFTGDLILEKWDWKAIMLKKSRFDKELRSLQSNLKVDWIFRESFVAQAKRLILFITQLIRGEININLVKDLEKKIAEQLIHDLNIDNNSRISSIFKFNFMLVITRLVYFTLKKYPEGPPLGENLMESEEPIEQKITWYVKKEMLKSESINESILKNLHEMEINDFNEVFSKIKRDIENDFIFSMSFNGYLESMIKQIILLMSTTKKKSRHSLDELAIIENLANYNFQWNVEKNPIFIYSQEKIFSKIQSKLETAKEVPTTLDSYSTNDLIEDFRNELQNYPIILSKKFPERIKRFNGTTLSLFWDNSEDFITRTKQKIRKKNFKIPGEDLRKLEQKVKENYGQNASKCLELIENYKTGKINGLKLIESLMHELGKRSNQIRVTNQELSLILTGKLETVRKILKRIRLESDEDYNPNYIIAISKLSLYEEQFEDLLGDKAYKLKEMIRKYIAANPEIKDYPNQQYTITNPNFFSNLERESSMKSSIPKFYWLGFLWADGRYDEEWGKIVFKLQAKDFRILERFADAVGFNQDRIKYGSEFREIDDEVIQYDYVKVKFGCKPMAEDLIKYEFLDFKKGRIELPQLVIRTLIEAKKLALKSNIKYYQTIEGKCALSFLLGFYDGDGTLLKGKHARISNSNKIFLDEVKIVFRLHNRVRVTLTPEKSLVTEIFYMTHYSLNIDIETFRLMLDAFEGSMERKRPIKS